MSRPFACDGVIIQDGRLVVIKRGKEPYKGGWALPGGRIEDNETTEQCLVREMKEETGLDIVPVKLVGIYSAPDRDPRGIIAATYICKVVGGELKAGDDAAEAYWFDLDKVPKLGSDHGKMLADALAMK
jgi:8-oxo-dGTP diphosphatase